MCRGTIFFSFAELLIATTPSASGMPQPSLSLLLWVPFYLCSDGSLYKYHCILLRLLLESLPLPRTMRFFVFFWMPPRSEVVMGCPRSLAPTMQKGQDSWMGDFGARFGICDPESCRYRKCIGLINISKPSGNIFSGENILYQLGLNFYPEFIRHCFLDTLLKNPKQWQVLTPDLPSAFPCDLNVTSN